MRQGKESEHVHPRRQKVFVNITGGLGNQLFQYAAGREVAKQSDAHLRLLSPRNGWPEGHPTLLDILPGLTFTSNIEALISKGTLAHLLTDVIESDFDPPASLAMRRTTVMRGLFQHPQWWRQSAKEISSAAAKYHAEALSQNSSQLVIAFRRTDYVRMGIDLPFDYYDQALGLVDFDSNSETRLVCEDKSFLAWAARALERRGLRVRPVMSNRPLDDFWAIAGARQVIMANSSFSWWATAIGDAFHSTGERHVVTPCPWLPPQKFRKIDGEAIGLEEPHWNRQRAAFETLTRLPTK